MDKNTLTFAYLSKPESGIHHSPGKKTEEFHFENNFVLLIAAKFMEYKIYTFLSAILFCLSYQIL